MTRLSAGRRGALAGLAAFLLSSAAWAVEPKQAGSYLDGLEFSSPELDVASSAVPLEEVLDQLPNRAAWEAFLRERESGGAHERVRAFIDPRTGSAANVVGAFPLVPGRGVGNTLRLRDLSARLGRPLKAVDGQVVEELLLRFVGEHAGLLGVDARQLGPVRAEAVSDELWQASLPQHHHGVPVRGARLLATVNNGNLVLIGTETRGRVDLDTDPALGAEEALETGFEYAGGRSIHDVVVRAPRLEVAPAAPPEPPSGQALGGRVGAGLRHRLVWSFVFRRPPDEALWEVLVDARGGEVLAFQDRNQYAKRRIVGGVYPITSTEVCPTPQTCGAMQSGWPMPFADTGFAPPNDFTHGGGMYDWFGGTATTTLAGRYVAISDTCGPLGASSATGDIDLGGANGQHDCTTPGFGGPGNTASTRSAFYEVNKIAEQARGWLPANPWLQGVLTTNVNIVATCNAFYSPGAGTINFFRSGGGCRNTGEIAGVFDHEWGHALDDNDSGGALSNTSEAYADIAAIYRLQTSCVGHGFWWTANQGCGMTSDGTSFNGNEAQVGPAHCDTDCGGVRDADWARHNPAGPDTALGFVCAQCGGGGGPCSRQVHCAAAPPRQAAWDLVTRDLTAAPFGLDGQTAFLVGNKLFYQGSGNIGLWYTCTCGVSSNGCAAANAYMQWLAADDTNGNLNDGTPHMTALFNAFDRHGIACATPPPVNSGCTPPAAPALAVTPGAYQNALSWNAVAGATRYWVFRTEGVAGCDFGKALIADLTTTGFTDTQVLAGRTYHYNVVAVGASTACFSRASPCVAGRPRDVHVVRNTVSTTNAPVVNCPAGTVVIGGGCSDDFTSTRLRSSWPVTSPPFIREGWACVFEANPGSLTAYAVCTDANVGRQVVRSTIGGGNVPFVYCPAGTVILGGGCSDDFTSTLLESTWPLTAPPYLNDGWACVFQTNPGSLTAYGLCGLPSLGRQVVKATLSSGNVPFVYCPAGTEILAGGCSDDFTSTVLQSTWPLTVPSYLSDGWACVFRSNPGSLTAYAVCKP